MGRADRIHHRERLKKKRRYYFGMDLANNPAALGQAVNTPHPCSCPGCGNQRKYEGRTMQERKQAETWEGF